MEQLLNTGWKFLETELGTDIAKVQERIADFQDVQIPHDWLITDTNALYRDSTGWYVRELEASEEMLHRNIFLNFDGVYMDSTVYLNGIEIFEWKYGYSPFTVPLTEHLHAGANEIMVRVNHQAPNSRWYSGAGIFRDVTLLDYDKTYIPLDGIYIVARPLTAELVDDISSQFKVSQGAIDPHIYEQDNFLVYVDASVCGEQSGLQSEIDVDVAFPEGLMVESVIKPMKLTREEVLDDGSTCIHIYKCYLIKSPHRWDIDDPYLYQCEIALMKQGKEIQKIQQRIGFKDIEFTTDRGLFLNGRHIKLNGVCEHHDLGAIGSAFHVDAMRRKIRILQSMGVNAIRLTHNMAARHVLELADEMGVLLISEGFDMWEKPKTEYDYARFFKDWHGRDVHNWICRDRNHVSVIMWSIGNEIYDTHADEHGQEITTDLMDLVRKYDPYRNAHVTIGSNYMPWENAQKCADIVKYAGYNYSEKYYAKHHAEHPDWIIYGSETSSIVQSRGIYHFPLSTQILSDSDLQCSSLGNSITSWGARSMEECVIGDRDMEYSLGQFLWSGFDYIGEPTPYHTKNSYFGQIDTAGFAKDAYYVWKAAWTVPSKTPVVHIFPYWDFNEGELIDVRICSNLPEVELFLNGESLGRQGLVGSHIIADYQVAYHAGVLEARAYDDNGRIIATDRRESFGDTATLRVVKEPTYGEIDPDTNSAVRGSLEFYDISALDAQGKPVDNACDRVHVSVTGGGHLIGLDNGDSSDYDQYTADTRNLFSGKLLAIVAIDDPSEAVTVNVRKVTKEDGEYIPARRVTMSAEDSHLNPDHANMVVSAKILPLDSDEKEITFEAVTEKGTPSDVVKLQVQGDPADLQSGEAKVSLSAVADGKFILRALAGSSTGHPRIISQLEFDATDFGTRFRDPYAFIYGIDYSYTNGQLTAGNDKGFATSRENVSIAGFDDIDFGKVGSDEITLPVFALDGGDYQIKIYDGIAREPGAELLGDFVYSKPSIWNVYQEETYKLSKMLKGIHTLSFELNKKAHIKGFSFKKYEKAWTRLMPSDADAVYGDTYQLTDEGALGIGNNVSFVYEDMNFQGSREATIVICGRCEADNTIHIRMDDADGELKQTAEFKASKQFQEQRFAIKVPDSSTKLTLLFLPGSCFDLKYFYMTQN